MFAKDYHPIYIAVFAALLAFSLGAHGQQVFADHSVLATGQWFKIPIETTGLYKITSTDVPSMRGIQCSNIALYGDAGGMLASNNTTVFHDDLTPIAIEVVDQQYAQETLDLIKDFPELAEAV